MDDFLADLLRNGSPLSKKNVIKVKEEWNRTIGQSFEPFPAVSLYCLNKHSEEHIIMLNMFLDHQRAHEICPYDFPVVTLPSPLNF